MTSRMRIGRAVVAGLVGTVFLTAIAYGAPVIALPELDIAGFLGSMFGLDAPAATAVGLAARAGVRTWRKEI